MIDRLLDVKKMMVWHIPVSVITLAIGIYLALICVVPSFAPEQREMLMSGVLYIVIPYVIFFLIGSPLYTLWLYTQINGTEGCASEITRPGHR